MDRIPETELMDEPENARAYAQADFAEPHNRFVALFRERFQGQPLNGAVLDLGCGPADVTIRFARAFPGCIIHGVDGAQSMLKHGREALVREGLTSRIHLFQGLVPAIKTPQPSYDTIISNSLLHHLPDPMALWACIKAHAAPQAIIFIMDLFRPASKEAAKALMERYAKDEPPVLQEDFYHSLCAGFRADEVKQQLAEAGLAHLSTEEVSDRHLVVYGRR